MPGKQTAADRMRSRLTAGGGTSAPKWRRGTAIERMRERIASQRLSEEQRMIHQERESMTHRPVTSTPLFTDSNSNLSAELAQAQDVGTGIADKSTRMGLAEDMQLGGRLAVETGSAALGAATGGGSVAARAAAVPAIRRIASAPVIKKAGSLIGSSIGEATGALGSQAFDPIDDPFDNAKNALIFGTFADGLGGAISAGVKRVRQGGSNLTDHARSTIRILGDDSPTPGRLSNNRAIDVAENITEASLVSGNRIKRKNELASKRAVENVEGYVDTFLEGASREEVNQLVGEVIEGRLGAFKESAEALYKQVDELAPVGVETGSLIELRNSIVRENQSGGLSSGLDQVVRAIDRTLGVPKGRRGIEANVMVSSKPRLVQPKRGQEGFNPLFPAEHIQVRDAKESVPFAEYAKLRSDMLGAQRDATDTFANQMSGAAKRSSKVVDDAMTAAAAAIDNPEAFEMWRTANAFWKDGADAFSEGVMKSLANRRPDELFSAIMQGNHEQQIRRFRKLVLGGVGDTEDTAKGIRAKAKRTLSDPNASATAKELAQARLSAVDSGEEAWKKFKGQFMANIISGSDTGSGLVAEGVSGTRTIVGSSALKRLSDFGDSALAEVFPKKSERRQFERALRAIEMTQKGTGIGEGRIAIQLAQAGAVIAAVTAPGAETAGAAATVTIPPALMAVLFTNPKFVRWMTLGAKRGVSRKAARMAFARMAEIAARNGARVRGADGQEFNPSEPTAESRNLRATNAVANRRGRTQGAIR